ncbi:MAG: TonB-dependent receptor [Rikenellaceae bacterium]
MHRAYILLIFLTSSFSLHAQNKDSISNEIELKDIVINSNVSPLKTIGTQQFELSFEELDQLPQFMGTVDAIRTLQLLPGVQTTGDIASGLYIQGSEPAHNLFLIDGAPIYVPIHLLGFFPVLNSDHMESITLDKGYISPSYSGRLSSVVNTTSRNDIPEKISLSGDITLLSTSLTLNTPTWDSGNLIISGRFSYLNPILKAVEKVISTEFPIRYGMNDINFTWNQKIGAKDIISLSGYYGRDNIYIDYEEYSITGENQWSNSAVSASWRHIFSENSELNTTIYNTTYSDLTTLDQDVISFDLVSSLNDFGGKIEQKFTLGNSAKINFGATTAYRTFSPQQALLYGLSDVFSQESSDKLYNMEYGVYGEAFVGLSPKTQLTLGARYSGVASQSSGIEPRAKITYNPNDQLSLSTSYTRQYQYINQVVVSNTGIPTNYFVGTSELSPAQRSDNYSIDVSYKAPSHTWGISALLYYRDLKNQYENTSQLVTLIVEDKSIYSRFEIGSGYTYGSEYMLNYNFGRLKGWVSYTLSWALRDFENINNGETFYASNDRRHDLSVVGFYQFNNDWTLSSNFIFASGNPITLSKGIYTVAEQYLSYYSEKNAARMPNYQRLDITASHKLKIRWLKSATLNFSVYNIYAYQNTFFYFTKVTTDIENDQMELYLKGNTLFTIIPSIGLSFKF